MNGVPPPTNREGNPAAETLQSVEEVYSELSDPTSANTGPPAPAAFAASDPTGPSGAGVGEQRWLEEGSGSNERM